MGVEDGRLPFVGEDTIITRQRADRGFFRRGGDGAVTWARGWGRRVNRRIDRRWVVRDVRGTEVYGGL